MAKYITTVVNIFSFKLLSLDGVGCEKIAELSENIDSSPEHAHDRP
jgi:hypothetical protein